MKKINEETLFETKWLKVNQDTFQTDSGETFKWDKIIRKNLKTIVVIIPFIKKTGEMVIIKQFRPAINGYILGFPAGFCEDNNIELAGIRELKEETGYTGKIISRSVPLLSAAGISEERSVILYAEIDEELPENQNPVQNLELEEKIEVFKVKIEDLKNFIIENNKKGIESGIALWHIANNVEKIYG